MSVEELSRQEGTINTALNLKVGKVTAKVKTVEGLGHNFTLRSPTSTASVRGTEFEFDGFAIKVTDGEVVLVDIETGEVETVFQGEISGGEVALNAGFSVSPYTSYTDVEEEIVEAVDTDEEIITTGSIVIDVVVN
jgi:hypothetical protein